MEISLSDFSYYFSVTGDSGGLASVGVTFRPYLYEGQEIDDVKAVARSCMDKYMEVLDPLYNDVLDGKKEPELTDSPHSVSTGYHYVGHVVEARLHSFNKDLQAIFGEDVPEPHGDLSPYQRQQVKIMYSFYKDVARLHDVTVNVQSDMSHVLNVGIFQFTRRLAGVRIEQQASDSMQQLEEVLKLTAERENLDYYEMMTRSLGRDSG